jgi:ABC-type sugar transport system permease subunit/maltose-binding protein MalE
LTRLFEKGGWGSRIASGIFSLVALLCLFPLSASAQDITLDLWHAYRGNEASALQDVVLDFEKANPNIHVSVLQVPDETFANKVFTGVPQGSGPDAFITAHDVIGNWADNKIIADLTPYISESELGVYHETTIKALRYTMKSTDGNAKEGIFAIPLTYKSPVLFYNKKLVSQPPKTTDELLEYLSKNTVMSCNVVDTTKVDTTCKQHYGMVYENTNLFFHSVWLNGFGGRLFDDNGQIELKNDGNAKSIEFAKKLNQYIPSGIDGARIKALFLEGTADMVINGPWFMAELPEQNSNASLQYGVVTLPQITEPGAPANAYGTPYVTAEGIYMARSTKSSIALSKMKETDKGYVEAKQAEEARRAATIKLMKYIASDGAYKRMIKGKQMVAFKAAYDQLAKDPDPSTAFIKEVAPVFLAQLDHAQPSSNRPEMGSLWASMQQALQKSLFGGPSGETPYLLFLFLSLVVAGFVFIAKATNPSVTTPEKHRNHIIGAVASFILSGAVFYWLSSVQGNNKNIDAVSALAEAQSRVSVLKPPPVEEGNPWVLATVILGMIAILCILGIRAYKKHKASHVEYTDNKIAAVFVAPAVIGMIVLVFLPFIIGAFLSFFSYENGEFTYVGLQNFIRLFSSDQASFIDSMSIYFTFVVTVLWTITNVALHVGIGMCLALLLREPWLKLKGIYRVLLIVPWAMPNYITALIWRGMFDHNFGAINGLLKSVGLTPIAWYDEFLTSFAANLTTNTWLGFPFMMVVTLGALQAIPRDLEDAAAVDGATAWQRFRHVTFPLLKPALMPSVVLGSIWTFNAFNIIYLVSKGSPDGSTEILVSEAYKWAFERQYQYGYAAAYAMVVFVILVLYSKLTQLVLKDSTAEAK